MVVVVAVLGTENEIMSSPVKIEIDPSFVRNIGRWAAASGKEIGEAFRIQARLLAHELIQRTPPFSGKSIKRIMDARNAVMSADLEGMTARQVGARRVEKDIRSIFWTPEIARTEWGVRQRCEGRQAIRMFANKKGEVYGVDEANFLPNATHQQLSAVHQRNRTGRGGVSRAGRKTRDIGRWKWMDVVVTSKQAIDEYIRKKVANVGRGKGGWAQSFMALGGRMSRGGWIGRHAEKVGASSINLQPFNADITLINKSEWASGGDDMRIIPAAIAGRNIRIVKDMERILKAKWGVIR